ncbi:GTP-binding protein [Schistosoma japonicum]|uniref:GTP-binding protein n=1 Tax=Schistosoma japonicum TaxID=6182 RepID=A0A4Z2D7Q6_SCHJA|nr:Ras-related protein RabA [Schistosoma japonicum]TNN12527.1 GTP-binding protein [Schistosoma japonicum]
METNSIDFDNNNNNDDVSKRIKIILVGDSNVGKSSLVQEFTKKSHEIDPISTVGTDLKLHEIRINGELIKLYIWDTAGTERFRNHMCPSYFRHAQGALIVYDVSCSKSFEELSTWVKMIEKYSGSRLVKVIIGNKTDLPCRAITKQLAEEYAKSINCPYLETSAKTGMNVQQSFITLIQTIIEKNSNELKVKEKSITLHEKPVNRRKRCCNRF